MRVATNFYYEYLLVKIHRDELDSTLAGDPYKYAKTTGRDELEKYFESYARPLIGENGLVSDQFLIERTCPLCNNTAASIQFIKYGFTTVKCDSCGFRYANPMLRQDLFPSAELELGALSDRHLKFISGDAYLASAALRFEYELQKIFDKFDRTPSNLLEIGCSIGIGLDIAKRHRLEAEGVEPNRMTAQIAAGKGHKVHHKLFNKSIYPDMYFDIVMSMDVLEHVPDPVEFLTQIREVLSDDGIAMIQVPNAGALICKLEKEKNQIFNGLIHLNYFTPESLDSAASRAGLINVSTETILSELGKIRQYSSHKIENAIGGSHVFDSDQNIHQDWILDNGLGYKILGFYTK